MLALDAKVYLRTGGTYNAPSWTDVGLIENFSVNPTWDEGEANYRGSRVKRSAKTLLGLEFSGRLKKKPGDTAYEALMNALVGDDAVDLMVLDGPLNQVGVRGWRVDCQIFGGNEDQSISNKLYVEIVAKPTDTDNPARAVKVGAGPATQYSTIGGSPSFS